MTAVGRVGVTAVGALTAVALARLLGPSGWGAFFVAQSLLVLLTVATTLGVEHGIVYYVSSGRWEARFAFGTALKVALATGSARLATGVRVERLVTDGSGRKVVAAIGVGPAGPVTVRGRRFVVSAGAASSAARRPER